MERNSTIAAWRLPGGINSAADKGVSAMILSGHDSVPPTFADKQVNAYGAPGLQRMAISAVSCRPRALTRRGTGAFKQALRQKTWWVSLKEREHLLEMQFVFGCVMLGLRGEGARHSEFQRRKSETNQS